MSVKTYRTIKKCPKDGEIYDLICMDLLCELNDRQGICTAPNATILEGWFDEKLKIKDILSKEAPSP